MRIIQANLNNIDTVHSIVQTIGLTIYPHYYPKDAVEFFMNFHNKDSVKKDIKEGKVFCFNKNFFLLEL